MSGAEESAHCGGSKEGGWVYTIAKLGAQLEIPHNLDAAPFEWTRVVVRPTAPRKVSRGSMQVSTSRQIEMLNACADQIED